MEQLGIQPSLLLAQLVNFGIIVFILSKFLFRPILTMLEKRKKEIAEGLAASERMQKEEEKLKEKQEKLLDVARKEARELVDEARKQAKEEEKEIIAEGHKESQEIIEKGKNEVERLKEQMEKDVQSQAVQLAVAMSKRLMSSVLSAEDQHKLIEKHLKELKSLKA